MERPSKNFPEWIILKNSVYFTFYHVYRHIEKRQIGWYMEILCIGHIQKRRNNQKGNRKSIAKQLRFDRTATLLSQTNMLLSYILDGVCIHQKVFKGVKNVISFPLLSGLVYLSTYIYPDLIIGLWILLVSFVLVSLRYLGIVIL